MKFIKPDWPAPQNIQAYTTTRHGWTGVASSDTSLPSALQPPQLDLNTLFNLPQEPFWLTQKHGNTVIKASAQQIKPLGDASFTAEPNQVCVVLTADCLPLLVCNKNSLHIAAIHAGWRGLANGIIENTLKSLPGPTQDLLVWLGPAIGPQKFEVGTDVYEAFLQLHVSYAASFKAHAAGKWLADIYGLAKIQLKQLGVTQIYGGQFCTYTQKDLFFSYRRDKGITGRMASLIWISDK